VAHARALAPGGEQLVVAMKESDWVAEEPEAHLLPHLSRACSAPGSPLTIEDAAADDAGVLVVSLRWAGGGGNRRSVTEAVWALLGSMIETASYVHGPADFDWESEATWEVATGMLAPDTTFAPHGHVLRLVVRDAT
jgi:hypothetical protein